MTCPLYMDVHVKRAVTDELRQRGVDVLTAQQDHHATASDPTLLDRATSLGRVLVSEDTDFLIETDRRQHSGETFAGLAHIRQNKITVGRLINDLELLAKVYEPIDMVDRVEHLPL